MKKHLLIAALCSLTLAACLGGSKPAAKEPKFSDARSTMAKIGGRPLPVFEFSAKVDDEDNKIVAVRAFVSTSGAYYKRNGDNYELVEPKSLPAEYIANVSQVRVTVDPAKEEAMATHLNSEASGAAFQIEVDWQSPEGGETQTTRSPIYSTDHETIAAGDLAKEIK